MRWLLVGLVGLGLGCGDDPVSPLDARKELAGLGFDYTTEAFFGAALRGALMVVKLFVDAGMSVNTAVNDGSTALHFAAVGGHLEVVKYLVEQGADVNAKIDDDVTPLLLTVFGPFMTFTDEETGAAIPVGDHRAVEQYLVEQGADVNMNGVTLEDIRAILPWVLLSEEWD